MFVECKMICLQLFLNTDLYFHNIFKYLRILFKYYVSIPNQWYSLMLDVSYVKRLPALFKTNNTKLHINLP